MLPQKCPHYGVNLYYDIAEMTKVGP